MTNENEDFNPTLLTLSAVFNRGHPLIKELIHALTEIEPKYVPHAIDGASFLNLEYTPNEFCSGRNLKLSCGNSFVSVSIPSHNKTLTHVQWGDTLNRAEEHFLENGEFFKGYKETPIGNEGQGKGKKLNDIVANALNRILESFNPKTP